MQGYGDQLFITQIIQQGEAVMPFLLFLCWETPLLRECYQVSKYLVALQIWVKSIYNQQYIANEKQQH